MDTQQPPLRIGVLLDGYEQPAWIEALLRQLAASDRMEIALVIMNGTTASTERLSGGHRLARWWKNRSSLPYALYRRVDRARYAIDGDPEESSDLSPLLADAPLVRVLPRMTRHCDYFDDEAIAQIRARGLDVALRFGFRILKGDALDIARYGVWSFHHGDNRNNRGGPAGFWEVMQLEPVTGAVLQVLSEELDAGLVLGRSYASTDPISVTANKHHFYWQASQLLTASLMRLDQQRDAFLAAARTADEWEPYSRPLFVQPGARQMSRLALGLISRLIKRKLKALIFTEQWFLAYRISPGAAGPGNVPDGTFYRFKEILPPADRFWADPMPAFEDGKHFIFYEEFVSDAPKAHICVVEVADDGTLRHSRKVLDRPYHLSYPFVFKWGTQWYMIPETSKNRTVELYRATSFPDQWELDRVLLSGVAATDATVVELDGRWWMFVGIGVTPREAGLLHIYHAPTPLGPWEPHALNPVKLDVRSNRPAGPLFRYNGNWYRPAQCGAPSYGSSMTINRILDLSPTSFQEEVVSQIHPTWRAGLSGTHTIAAAGGLTVIDARRVLRRF
jgi:hypothetical protein